MSSAGRPNTSSGAREAADVVPLAQEDQRGVRLQTVFQRWREDDFVLGTPHPHDDPAKVALNTAFLDGLADQRRACRDDQLLELQIQAVFGGDDVSEIHRVGPGDGIGHRARADTLWRHHLVGSSGEQSSLGLLGDAARDNL